MPDGEFAVGVMSAPPTDDVPTDDVPTDDVPTGDVPTDDDEEFGEALVLSDAGASVLSDAGALVLSDAGALVFADVDPLLTEDVDDLAAAGEEAEEDAAEEAEEDAGEEAAVEEAAVEEEVDAAAWLAGELEQFEPVAPPTPVLSDPAEWVVVPVLGLTEVEVAAGVSLGLESGLVLGLVLGLPDGAELGLVVLWLDDVAGAAVVWVTPAGELVPVRVADEAAEDREHDVVGTGSAAALLNPPPAGEGIGVLLWVSAPGLPALLVGLLLVRAWLMVLKLFTITWRAGGTTDRITPTANTAAPTAKAGRSIASRQSLGRCGSRRASLRPRLPPRDLPPPRAGTRRRASAVTTPEKASQMPSSPLGRAACAGRDRILSRIRSRPSAPGST